MPKLSYIFKGAVAVFMINTAGRVFGNLYDSVEIDMIGVALSFVGAFFMFYSCVKAPFERIVISLIMGYVISSAVKEIALDPTKFYPAELISLVPVLLTIIKERKRLKNPAAQNT